MLPTLEIWALRALAVLALLAGCWWAGDKHGHEVEQAAQNARVLEAQAQVKVANDKLNAKAEEADHAQELNRIALERAAAGTRAELQRLRDVIASGRDLPGSAANPGLAAYAADGDRLLAECAQRYSEVDAAKAGLASRLGGLQRLVGPTSAPAATDEVKDSTP